MTYTNVPKKRPVYVGEDGELYSTNPNTNKLNSHKLDIYSGLSRTTADMVIWVSTTGHDNFGEGTQSKPYATITRAFEDIPTEIRHSVAIRIAAGTYTDFPDEITKFYSGPNGQLILEGYGDDSLVAGPFDVDTFTEDTNITHSKITVTGASWSEDQFYGKWLRVISGTAAGYVIPIYKNTADTITTARFYSSSVGVPTVFSVVDPPVTLVLSNTISFSSLGSASIGALASTSSSRIGIIGIKFDFQSDLDGLIAMRFSDLRLVTCFSTIRLPYPDGILNYHLALKDVRINMATLVDTSKIYDQTWAVSSSYRQLLCTHGSVPPHIGYGAANYRYSILCSGTEVRLYRITTRLYIEATAAFDTDVYYCACAGVNIFRQARGWASRCYFDSGGFSGTKSITTHSNSYLNAGNNHIEVCGATDALYCYNNAYVELGGNTIATGAVSRYGVYVCHFGKVTRTNTDGITGTTNAAYFLATASGIAWPSNGKTVTDGYGAYVRTG